MTHWKAFEMFVSDIMEKEQIPGVAVALSIVGETIYQQGFGMKDLTTKEPITPNTIFENSFDYKVIHRTRYHGASRVS